jgi:hypothetical protein
MKLATRPHHRNRDRQEASNDPQDLQLSLTFDAVSRLRGYAVKDGRPVAALVRDAVADYLKQRRRNG